MRAKDTFFEGKRPWSLIKDKVLHDYMQPYLAKVNRRREQILLVDGYAGPGLFDDGTLGSPLIMCQLAEKFAPEKYRAVFVNKQYEHHVRLSSALQDRGLLRSATPIHSDARKHLAQLASNIGNQTLFLYLDPFGLRGCEFALLTPFLQRSASVSTELLFLIHMPIVHRLAMTQQHRAGMRNHRLASSYFDCLTQVLGGEYWKDILWKDGLQREEREQSLIDAYTKRIREYLPFTYYCPVQETQESVLKYYIVFATRHEDAVLLMNEIMAKAYHDHMHQQRHSGTLWESQDWRDVRGINNFADDLDEIVLATVRRHSGRSAAVIWPIIVKSNFMRFTKKEFNEALARLEKAKLLVRDIDLRTRRVNENCAIHVSA